MLCFVILLLLLFEIKTTLHTNILGNTFQTSKKKYSLFQH